MAEIITLILVALSVGLGNFAASIAIGLGGVSKAQRTRIALVFGLFETGMPIVGLVIGRRVASSLGGHANIIGATLLTLAGVYFIYQSLHKSDKNKVARATGSWGKLLITGLALSVDNLIVGFGLGTRNVSLPLSIVIIGITSVGLALVGLEIGKRLNSKVGEYSGVLSGLILIFVGVLIGFNIL